DGLELRVHARAHRLHVAARGNVEGVGLGLVAHLADLAADALRRIYAAGTGPDGDGGAGRGQRQRVRAPDAARSAGHECFFPEQAEAGKDDLVGEICCTRHWSSPIDPDTPSFASP